MNTFLLLVIFCGVADGTRFYLNGTVSCETSEPEWCFTITALELDAFSAPDPIANYSNCLPNNVTTAKYTLDGTHDGDGWFDGFYELGYQIIHTCENYDVPFELVALQQQLPVWKPFYWEEKQFDLNGNNVTHIHSFCDEPYYECYRQKNFYFVLSVDFNVKRRDYKVIRLY